jgi:hypothetical protein
MKAQQEDRDRLTGCCLVLDFYHVFLSVVKPFNNDAAYAAIKNTSSVSFCAPSKLSTNLVGSSTPPNRSTDKKLIAY